MSPFQARAWLGIWGMGPAYAVYFALQLAQPPWLNGMLPRIGCLAAAACVHAAIYLTGFLVLKARERGQGLLADERDRMIDGRATRIGYFALMFGMIVVGVVMPFTDSGWTIVNAALLAIVLVELLRNVLIALGYRGSPSLAY